MRRVLCCFALVFLMLSGFELAASAQTVTASTSQGAFQVTELRAGGGSGGGSSGGGHFFRSFSRRIRRKLRNNEPLNAAEYAIIVIEIAVAPFVIVSSIVTCITAYRRRRKRIRATKELLQHLSNTDNAWKYDKLIERVTKSYFAIQKAWSKGNMESAREYMAPELFDEFQKKLDVMKSHNERNILKNIKLNKYYAAAVYDSPDDEMDNVWFYIGGSMVDFIYDFQLKKVTQGTHKKVYFVEYWKYVRNESGEWVLAKIVQENDRKNLPFADEISMKIRRTI